MKDAGETVPTYPPRRTFMVCTLTTPAAVDKSTPGVPTDGKKEAKLDSS